MTRDARLDVLSATNLELAFGAMPVLRGVSISIGPSEVLGLIGPNGSGKTTLLNALSGFLRPARGVVARRGTEVTRIGPHARSRQGMVRTFQEAMVFPGVTVAENLDLALSAASGWRGGPPRKTVDECLEYVGLLHVRNHMAGDISWGQSRLLGIALAMICDPEVILLDEPFAGLSPVAAESVSEVLVRLRTDGRSLCIVDHELPYLLPLCDRLAVLVQGQVLAEGTPKEILAMQEVHAAYLGV